jgi:hypothetical protein
VVSYTSTLTSIIVLRCETEEMSLVKVEMASRVVLSSSSGETVIDDVLLPLRTDEMICVLSVFVAGMD